MTQTPQPAASAGTQFDALPYPNLPLEQAPGDHPAYLTTHSCVIPYYLRDRRVIDPSDRWILDAGCGSGFKAMALALANPGAHIVGVDISPKSIALAKQRVEVHQIPNPIEFHCLPLEELSSLPQQFDYINCDETLYLLPDPLAGLQAMRATLKPEGIMRVNLHSSLQRADCYRMQELFKGFGCLEGNLTEEEIELVRQTMEALEDRVVTKRKLWNNNPELKTDPEKVMANFLLRGDKGYTMLEFSELLRQANLEFINMVNWREWNLQSLFKNVEDLPIEIALGLADMSFEEQLHMFELLHPVHRLLDLYCGHPGQGTDLLFLEEWTATQWQTATVHWHPQLRTLTFRNILIAGARKLQKVALDKYFPINNQSVTLDGSLASCLYPLLDQPLSMRELCDRWLQIRPVDPITLKPIKPEEAFLTVRNVLMRLESAGYILIEPA